MGDLFLLRGLPNAGKSTVANHLATGAVFAADDYFEEDGKYVFDHSRLPEAHAACQNRVRAALSTGLSRIAVANTFPTQNEIIPYLEMGDKYGYNIHVMTVEKMHEGDNGHNVPPSSVEMMVKSFEWLDSRLSLR